MSSNEDSITEDEQRKFWDIFVALKPVNGLLDGGKASSILKISKLPDSVLAKVWDISDIDDDGQLDFEEFCVAMHLIYNVINSGNEFVPSSLPNSLIPSSKAHLVTAKLAIEQKEQSVIDESLSTSDLSEKNSSLSTGFDWYISPSERLSHESIYTEKKDADGLVDFDSLWSVIESFENIPASDVRHAWRLVNPERKQKVGKEQTIYFLHALSQRNKKIRIPDDAPYHLKSSFKSKDVDSVAAEDYHKNTKYGSASNIERDNSNDLLNSKDKDWERVQLVEKLDLLRKELIDAESRVKVYREEPLRLKRIAEQLADFLKLKEKELQLIQNQNKVHTLNKIRQYNSDIGLLKQQIDSLNLYLKQREALLTSSMSNF